MIVDPSDVFFISNDPSTIVASRLNDCVKTLKFLVKKQKTAAQTPNPAAWPSAPTRQPETVPLVLMNIPKGLNVQNPTKKRKFIQKLGCADKVKHITARRDRLVVHLSDEESAVAAVATIPSSLKIRAKVIKSEHFSIVKMDTEFKISQIPDLFDSVISARRFGNSVVAQVKFRSKETFDLAIKYGVKIEYSLFRVTMPIENPKQCQLPRFWSLSTQVLVT